jgi:hypothetical protein
MLDQISPVLLIAVFLYCLFGRGLILNGRAGIFYALQRMVAEANALPYGVGGKVARSRSRQPPRFREPLMSLLAKANVDEL